MARKRTADKQHRWLSLIEVTGVVFSEPVLAEAAPSGFPSLDKKVLARFHKAREIWNLPKGMVKEDAQAVWIQFILEEILRHRPTDWFIGAAIPESLVVNLAVQQETIRPTRVLIDNGSPVMVMVEVPRSQSLDRPWIHGTGRWKASPTTKLERLLRETGVEMGLITNGEAWRLLVASPTETASWITWTATTWAESPLTLAAFRDLLGTERFFAGSLEGVPLELIRRSRERQLDVADQLGEQARDALALFIRALDDVDTNLEGKFLQGYTDKEVFETGVAFVMRLLFLFFAEENSLLPHGSVAYDRAYGVLFLLTELEHQNRLSPDRLRRSFSAYPRLLATSRLIYDGSVDPDIRIAPHGGRLFDPTNYPLLEGLARDGSCLWDPPSPPRVADSVLREILRSLKYAVVGGVRQLVSYRTLAVEQIGHMYEGLLDLQVLRAPADTVVLLLKPSPDEPEPKLTWSALADLDEKTVISLLAKTTKRTREQIARTVERGRQRDPERSVGPGVPAGHAVAYLLKHRGNIRPRGRYLGYSEDRHTHGTHYTPLAVTEPMVRQLLEPLVRTSTTSGNPGAVCDPRYLLSLRICDPAVGSGAFLVQTARFISDALVEAWEAEQARLPEKALTLPFAAAVSGSPEEILMPSDRAEKEIWARRYVVEHCIYGVDINPLAVEMAKLSLWLIALSKDKPFTFLDHAIRSGNSVLGVNGDQLRSWSVDPRTKQQAAFAQKAGEAALRAVELRRRLWQLPPATAEKEKAATLDACASATTQARIAADLLVSAWVGEGDRDQALCSQTADELLILQANSHSDWSEIDATARSRLKQEVPFHWAIEFPEVFVDGDGFDAVVGNPPYVRQELLSTLKRYLKEAYEVYVGTADLYTYFYELALRLVRPGGRLSMIVTNKWMKASYGKGVRAVLASSSWIESIINFGHAKQIFRGVDVFPCILTACRPSDEPPTDEAVICVIDREKLQLHELAAQIRDQSFFVPRKRFSEEPWSLESQAVHELFKLIEERGKPLTEYLNGKPFYGIKTGRDSAFVIDTSTRDRLVSEDPASDEIILKMAKGRDLERWQVTWKDKWMIFVRRGINIRNYPAILRYLEGYREVLEPRPKGHTGKWAGRKGGAYEWYEIQDPVDYWQSFLKPKIFYQEIQFHPRYSIDTDGLLGKNGTFFLPTNDLYLLAVLNSPLIWWFNWRHLGHMKDDALNPSGVRMQTIPIAEPLETVRSSAENAVTRLIGHLEDRRAVQRGLVSVLVEKGILPGLEDFGEAFDIDEKSFLRLLVKTRARKLIKDEQAEAVSLWRSRRSEVAEIDINAKILERKISQLTLDAYGLSEAEQALLWSTSPPRMPIRGS